MYYINFSADPVYANDAYPLQLKFATTGIHRSPCAGILSRIVLSIVFIISL